MGGGKTDRRRKGALQRKERRKREEERRRAMDLSPRPPLESGEGKGRGKGKGVVGDLDVLQLLDVFLQSQSPCAHQLESYNYFVEERLPEIIEGTVEEMELQSMGDEGRGPEREEAAHNKREGEGEGGVRARPRVAVEFRGVFCTRATFTEADGEERAVLPTECEHRSITYQSRVIAKQVLLLRARGEGGGEEGGDDVVHVETNVTLGYIPVMVRSCLCNMLPAADFGGTIGSGECPYNPGGYFIIKGSKKVLVCQERTAYNRLYVFHRRKYHPKFVTYTEVRSLKPGTTYSTVTQVGVLPLPRLRGVSAAAAGGLPSPFHTAPIRLYAVISYCPDVLAIPLGVLFMALGVTGVEEMAQLVVGRTSPSPTAEEGEEGREELLDALMPTLEDEALHTITTQAQARAWCAASQRYEGSTRITIDAYFDELFLPHLAASKGWAPRTTAAAPYSVRALYVAYMARMTLRVYLAEQRRQAAKRGDPRTVAGKHAPVPSGSWEDRDHYANKHVTTVGQLFASQFACAWRKVLREMRQAAERYRSTPTNILRRMKAATVTAEMSIAISSNGWKGRGGRGLVVSQTFEGFNHAAGVANLRKLSTGVSESGKNIEPRMLHSSHLGVVCPSETPEGKRVGIGKALAMGCAISLPFNPVGVLARLGVLPGVSRHPSLPEVRNVNAAFSAAPTAPDGSRGFIVAMNGAWVGATDAPHELCVCLRALRRAGDLPYELGIAYDGRMRQVRLSSEAGRLLRPLLVVQHNELVLTQDHLRRLDSGYLGPDRLTWWDLTACGAVDVIDKDEEEHSVTIAAHPSELLTPPAWAPRGGYTHCDVHPSLMYGVGASVIPGPNHNQSPRVTYQASMGKQAIGVPCLNFQRALTGSLHVLDYPQRPLVSSHAARALHLPALPSGQNVIVAVGQLGGYNQEDSLLLNRAFIQRGGLTSSKYKTYTATVRSERGERFALPIPATPSALAGAGAGAGDAGMSRLSFPERHRCRTIRGRLDALGGEGGAEGVSDVVVAPGTRVRRGDVLIARVTLAPRTAKGGRPRGDPHASLAVDTSVLYDEEWEGVVSSVQRSVNGEGYEYVRVQTVQRRIPVVGDKFASRHAQKGTIGAIVPDTDLPFTRHGLIPDLVCNPACFPSRMTIAQMIECLTGKVLCASTCRTAHRVTLGEAFPGGEEDDADASRRVWRTLATVPQGTPFVRDFVRDPVVGLGALQRELRDAGYDGCGSEVMYDGVTGRPLKALIFIGPVHYQRLRHMVIDKIHARARGPRNAITRQPTEGRSLGGGFRVGGMERDNLAAQGAAALLKDRLMEQSDETKVWICSKCGIPCTVKPGMGSGAPPLQTWCGACGGTEATHETIPYATLQLFRELSGMGVFPRKLLSTKHNT